MKAIVKHKCFPNIHLNIIQKAMTAVGLLCMYITYISLYVHKMSSLLLYAQINEQCTMLYMAFPSFHYASVYMTFGAKRLTLRANQKL